MPVACPTHAWWIVCAMITLAHYITLGAILFCISVAGIFINRKNVIVLLMAIELMLLAVNMDLEIFL